MEADLAEESAVDAAKGSEQQESDELKRVPVLPKKRGGRCEGGSEEGYQRKTAYSIVADLEQDNLPRAERIQHLQSHRGDHRTPERPPHDLGSEFSM